MKPHYQIFLWMTFFSVVLSSCFTVPTNVPQANAVASTATEASDVWATSIAMTEVAVLPTGTAAARPTFTSVPTITPFPTFTKDPDLILTQLPEDQVYVAYEGPCEDIRYLGGIDDNHEEISYQWENEKFTMTWGFKNVGSCDIGPGYVLTYVAGEQMGSDRGKLKTIISPMENGKVSVNLQAPSKPGTFVSVYKFKNPQGYYFGPGFTKTVIVPNIVSCKPENQPSVDYGLYVVTDRNEDGTIRRAQFWSEKYWDGSGKYKWNYIYLYLVYMWKASPINPNNYEQAYCATFDDDILGPYYSKY